jgi:D-beta-D-heptose 7-phosphate kinase/D-beta-D-heptose 1-phosphate adenosyltransferase
MVRLTVVGDAFLDLDWSGTVERVCPDAPAPVLDADHEQRRAGGAGLAARLAASTLAGRPGGIGTAGGRGTEIVLVTALGADIEGEQVRADLAAAGVTVVDLGLGGGTPMKLRLRSAGQSLARVDRNCSPLARPGPWPDEATAAIEASDGLLVSDYGRGMAGTPALLALLHTLRDDVPVVWDPHVRGPRPPAGLDLLTPNLKEAAALAGTDGGPRRSPAS